MKRTSEQKLEEIKHRIWKIMSDYDLAGEGGYTIDFISRLAELEDIIMDRGPKTTTMCLSQENINNVFEKLPQFLTSQDLVNIGLYPSRDAVYLGRVRGHSPDFIKLKRKVLYPKSSVLEFIEQRMKKGSHEKSK